MGKLYEFPVQNTRPKKDLLFWIGLYIIMLVRYFYFGLHYYPVMDDYYQFGVYYRYGSDIWNTILMNYDKIAAPFAVLSDSYFFMRFWNQLWVVIFIICTMHFFCCYFLNQIFSSSGLKFGIIGIVAIALSASLHNSVYMISMSSKLVVGMFFTLASLWLFTIFIGKLKSGHRNAGACFSGFWILNLLSMGYSVQITALSLIFSIIVIFINRKELPAFSKIASFIIPFINATLIIAVYLIISGYKVLSIEVIINNYKSAVVGFINQITVYQWELSAYSLLHGLEFTDTLKGYFILLLLFGFSGYIFYSVIKNKMVAETNNSKNFIVRFVISIILTIFPYYIFPLFFNYDDLYYSLFPSYIGIALFADTIFDCITNIRILINGKRLNLNIVKSVTVLVFIPAFFIMTLSILDMYKKTYDTNMIIANNFLSSFEQSGYTGKDAEQQRQPMLLYDNTIKYSESPYHFYLLYNCTISDKAINGLVNSVSRKYFFERIQVQSPSSKSLIQQELLFFYPLFGIDKNFAVYELIPVQNADKSEIELITDTGDSFGYIINNLFEQE